jgi:hypothetical protein
MTADRIEEIQKGTAFPDSVSVQQALLQVWNECQQENKEEIERLKAILKEISDELSDF